jgi:predicted enzyme related to lactoylglutathione lyase
MGRPIVHWEFWTDNPERLAAFYEKAFDWGIRHVPAMNIHMVETGGEGGINGGITKPEVPSDSKVALYIDVDDLDAYVTRVANAGGKILVPKMDVPDVGQFSLFKDLDRRVLGLWQRQK